MYGNVLICTQNLAISGANQVLLNILNGGFFEGVVIVLSPSDGPLRGPFQSAGAAVRVGTISDAMAKFRDIRLALCNTVMTAPQVIELARRGIPHMWILHEWWPAGVLQNELDARNVKYMTEATVSEALQICHRCICVCEAQTTIYPIQCPKSVLYVGVPGGKEELVSTGTKGMTTFLCMGIVCPRKNQHTTVRLFKKFAGDRTDVRLIVVGARYIRDYEIEYVEQVKAEIADDPRVELHDVTSDPGSYYKSADVLLFNSLNEVTPLVLPEAMLYGVPVITTSIAGIPEMLEHGKHGFVLDPDDDEAFVSAMAKLADDNDYRNQLAEAGRQHATKKFTLDAMVDNYAAVARELAPTVVLLDMDGVIVDWDAGFRRAWGSRPLDRSQSYAMEDCVPVELKNDAVKTFMAPGFFRDLPPFKGAVAAVNQMESAGLQVWFCTSPILGHPTCCQEKVEWIQKHFGEAYVKRMILCQDKTTVRGDILIDDKPQITGLHPPTWRQCLFNAPYNQARTDLPRISRWDEWEGPVKQVLEKSGMKRAETSLSSLASFRERSGSEASSSGSLSTMASATDTDEPKPLKNYVCGLPDFSEELKAMGVYMADYTNWRRGGAKGARGEAAHVLRQVKRSYIKELTMNEAEDPTDMFCFRQEYKSWRQGRAKGNRVSIERIPTTPKEAVVAGA
jgi:5'-nucleotidase